MNRNKLEGQNISKQWEGAGPQWVCELTVHRHQRPSEACAGRTQLPPSRQGRQARGRAALDWGPPTRGGYGCFATRRVRSSGKMSCPGKLLQLLEETSSLTSSLHKALPFYRRFNKLPRAPGRAPTALFGKKHTEPKFLSLWPLLLWLCCPPRLRAFPLNVLQLTRGVHFL